MKKRTRVLVAMLTIVCVVLSNIRVMADDNRFGEVVDGSELTNQTEAEYIIHPRTRGIYLSNGSGHLVVNGFRNVTVTGGTNAYQNVDKIRVTLLLQRLEGEQWTTEYILSTKTANNAYTVSNTKTYSVEGNAYYRVYGTHVVIEGSKTETASSCTNAIWID